MPAVQHGSHGLRHRGVWYILILCAAWFGLQQILSVFYASGYFYLASLGFSDASISLIWLSTPVAGMLFQPFIGALSDACTHPLGRRRPFILLGTIVLVIAMLSLAWVENLTGGWREATNHPVVSATSQRNAPSWKLFIFVSTCIVVASLSIQPIQLGLRVMIVDMVPIHQQPQAHAWVAKLNLVGSIIGYGIGAADLTKRLSFFGETQMQIVCSLVSINLVVRVVITCCLTPEIRLDKLDRPIQSRQRYRPSLASRLTEMIVTKRVCTAQLFCWFAWFPFMYYMAKYVSSFRRVEHSSTDEQFPSQGEGTARTGSFAMLIFAVAPLMATMFLAWIVSKSEATLSRLRYGLSLLHLVSLRRLWLVGQLCFTLCMTATFFISSAESAYILVALLGLPWAVGTWVPFALISQDIQQPREGLLENVDKYHYEELAATVVGILNAAISAPQILAALWCSLFFYMFNSEQAGISTSSKGSEVWSLRVSGFSSLVAAWIIRGLPDTNWEDMVDGTN